METFHGATLIYDMFFYCRLHDDDDFDCRLQWNKSKFGGVNVLRVYPSDIWLPDIEVYNAKVMQLAVHCIAQCAE